MKEERARVFDQWPHKEINGSKSEPSPTKGFVSLDSCEHHKFEFGCGGGFCVVFFLGVF